jgi:hypothetical protein
MNNYQIGDVLVVKDLTGLAGLKITIIDSIDDYYVIHYSDDRPDKNYEGYGDNWLDAHCILDEITIANRILKTYENKPGPGYEVLRR